MANAAPKKKPMKSRKSGVKTMKRIQMNNEILKKYQ